MQTAAVPASPSIDRRYYGYPESAEYLGISVRHLAELVAQNHIQVIRHGRRVLFDRQDLDAYAQSQKH